VDLLFCNDYMPDLAGGIQAALPGHRVKTCPEDKVAEAAAEAAVLLPARAIIDTAVLDAAPQLRLVQQPGVGLDRIDVVAANARGVPVANVPSADGGLAQAVAEMALFLLIGAGRRYPHLLKAIRTQDWNVPFGHSLFGARVCVIGLGGIGSQLVRLLQPFGCEIVGVRRTPRDSDVRELGLAAVHPPAELMTALRGCRFIVLATPLTPETEGMINAESIAAMDDDTVIVNVARGQVIDREALIDALRSGKLSTAGIDVFWQEPVDPADPLFDYEVFTTPHASNACDVFVRETAAGVAENVRRLIANEPLLWEAQTP
jgi:phosphoglycerate dehydrogenase-like enzyme